MLLLADYSLALSWSGSRLVFRDADEMFLFTPS